jgi:predicted small secreted protein
MFRILLITVALLAAAPLLSACNTTAGAGKDISNTGQAISNSAQKLTP